ncbi:MAG: conjugal transfer protein TraX [Lachnospiraceae bacterium]|nr:conjugal transfer protein TraX [Lachnospiraceae bacterium]MDE6980742.1 conjugal transfer protein TraX [Lachnospiraceae bacterium]
MSETNSAQRASQQEKARGLSGSTLKLIAIVTMFIDHLGVVAFETQFSRYMAPYYIMRGIGRLAFPIYCFLLVEGFSHTRNVKKYALRLLLFAFLSEIPFDLAFNRQMFYWQYQNVFFTLLIGLSVIALMDHAKEISKGFLCFLWECAVLIAGIILAQLLHTDYGAVGVLAIVFIYLFRQNRSSTLAMGVSVIWLSAMNIAESPALIDILLVKFYNGKRGLDLKYIFYAFYPLHLLLLYFFFHFILKTV